MLKLFKNLKKEEWCMIAVSLIFIVLQVWLDLTMLEYMADITGLVQTPGSEMGDILAAGGKMLIVLGLQMLVKAPIMAVWAICKIADKRWQWTLTTGIAVAVLLVVVAICHRDRSSS